MQFSIFLLLFILFFPSCYEGWDYGNNTNLNNNQFGNIDPKIPSAGQTPLLVYYIITPDIVEIKQRNAWSDRLSKKRSTSWQVMTQSIISSLSAAYPLNYSQSISLSLGNNSTNSDLNIDNVLNNDNSNLNTNSSIDSTFSTYNEYLENEPYPFDNVSIPESTERIIHLRIIFDEGARIETPTLSAVFPNVESWNSIDPSGQTIFISYICQNNIESLSGNYFSQYSSISGQEVLLCQNPLDQQFLSRDDSSYALLLERAANSDAERLKNWINSLLESTGESK